MCCEVPGSLSLCPDGRGDHLPHKECKEKIKKCANYEDKIRSFIIKNIDSSHSAFYAECPCYKKELDKQKNRVNGML